MWSITSPRPSPPKQGHSEFSFSAAEHLVGGQGVNGWLQRLSGKDTLLRSWKGSVIYISAALSGFKSHS